MKFQNKRIEEIKTLDQQTDNAEVVKTLKAEAYDLNNTIKQQNNVIMFMCQELGVDLSNGFHPEEVQALIQGLKDNQVEMVEE
jgi:hypothetical protein